MIIKIQTPVNNSIETVLSALNTARDAAKDSHDWQTFEALSLVFEQVMDICPKTVESQILSVDDFIANARKNA